MLPNYPIKLLAECYWLTIDNHSDWTCEAKYAVLITDAYPHGNKYYKNNSGDRYPAGDPEGRVPENQIVQMIKRGITFYGLDVAIMSNQMY